MSDDKVVSELARRFLEDIWSKDNYDQYIDELIAPNFVMTLGVPPYRLEGPEGLRALTKRNRGAFQNLTYTVDEIFVKGTKAVAHWKMTAKHVDTWAGAPASNKDVSIKGMSLFNTEGNKLTACEVQNEGLGLLRQVGGVAPEVTPLTAYSTVEANKALVRRYIEELLMKGNFALAPELTGPNFYIERSAMPDLIRGANALQSQMQMLATAFPDLKLEVADLFAEGDKVAVRFIGPGTHTGDFFGMKPTGIKVVWKGIVIYHCADGKVQEAWAKWDDTGLLQEVQAAARAQGQQV